MEASETRMVRTRLVAKVLFPRTITVVKNCLLDLLMNQPIMRFPIFSFQYSACFDSKLKWHEKSLLNKESIQSNVIVLTTAAVMRFIIKPSCLGSFTTFRMNQNVQNNSVILFLLKHYSANILWLGRSSSVCTGWRNMGSSQSVTSLLIDRN